MPYSSIEKSLIKKKNYYYMNFFIPAGHYEKPNVIKFHPISQDILASAGYDCKVFIWNVETRSIEITLDATPDPVYCLSWSPDGSCLASVGKDHVIRIYKPRESTAPISTVC